MKEFSVTGLSHVRKRLFIFICLLAMLTSTISPALSTQADQPPSTNNAPTDIDLSNATVTENAASGTAVGTLSATDADAGDTASFALVAGTGDTDNASFAINGTSLDTAASFDFETQSSYSVLVQVTDSGSLTYSEAFTISVTDENETPTNNAPTDIDLSNSSVAENSVAGTTVGTLSATDADAGDTASFALVAGTGDTDNASFAINGPSLDTAASFDYETQSSYSVRVQVTDSGSLTYEEAFTISVTDESITLSGLTVSNVDADSADVEFTSDKVTSNSFTINGSNTTVLYTYVVLPSTATAPADFMEIAQVQQGGDIIWSAQNSFTVDKYYDGIELKSLQPATEYKIYIIGAIVANFALQLYEGSNIISETFTTTALPNQAPTDIDLSNSSVAENSAAGTAVGTLSATDADAGDTASFALVAGTGDADNASFAINGTSLDTATSFDYETQSSYSVRVQVTDSGSLSYEEAFTISVTDVSENSAPTDIDLSSLSIAENAGADATVGTLSGTDADAGDTLTFTLVSGTGSDDNASFTIDGTTLKAVSSFDYEAQSSYSIRVQVSDGSLAYEKAFTVSVTDVNEAPTDITLSSSSVDESAAVGTSVGDLSATDPDSANIGSLDTASFALVSGSGDEDNASFTIDGTTLKTAVSFDYETKSSYNVRVEVTDSGSLTYSESFTISVTNANEAPTDISLSSTDIDENEDIGEDIGDLSATDTDTGESFTFTLVNGDGDTDNASFSIDEDELEAAESFDYETKNSYSIRVQVSDNGGLTYEEQFTITINDVFENTPPSDIELSNSSVNEHEPLYTIVGLLSATDVDGSWFKYSIKSVDGSSYNMPFGIKGNILFTRENLDFEKKSSYQVRIEVEDYYDGEYEEVFTITVNDINELTETVAPTTPTNLRADNITRTGLRLQWRAATDNVAVTGYEIFRNGVLLTTTSSTSLNVTGLSANTTYIYTVRAFDAAGNKSKFSTALFVKTKR